MGFSCEFREHFATVGDASPARGRAATQRSHPVIMHEATAALHGQSAGRHDAVASLMFEHAQYVCADRRRGAQRTRTEASIASRHGGDLALVPGHGAVHFHARRSE
jgi:hypothetical protein